MTTETDIQAAIKADIAKLDLQKDVSLSEYGSWPSSVHQFDEDSINAIKTALASRRPLLLRGDPGTGKSQLARAAAAVLNRIFVYEVVNAHTESQDLLWRFDAVGRLAEAQSLAAGTSPEERKALLDTKRYACPGPLWWALCWESAQKVYQNSQYQLARPEEPMGCQGGMTGSVLLIDEIDKANAELPNGLLEILGNNSISIPWLNNSVIGGKELIPPLVIVTTNEERELPAAFIRRCLVLNLELPSDEAAFKKTMVERGQLHFDSCSEVVCRKAVDQLWQDRENAKTRGIVNLPGQAEYLDLLRALNTLAKTEAEQLEWLGKIGKFTFQKYANNYGR